MTAAALESLRWLTAAQQSPAGHFAPIGCHGFYGRGLTPTRFDQQPLEAQAMVLAALDAARLTGDPAWLEEAQRAFAWFLGRNDLALALYDPISGGCHDGLEVDRVNQNQGAESTLAFLLARLALHPATQGDPFADIPLEVAVIRSAPRVDDAFGRHGMRPCV
jgi:hypothetical protein